MASIAAVAVLTVGVAAAAMPLLGSPGGPADEPRFATAFHGISAETNRSLLDGVITGDEIQTLETQAQVLLDQVAQDPRALESVTAGERAGLLEALDAVETKLAQSGGISVVGAEAGSPDAAASPSTG